MEHLQRDSVTLFEATLVAGRRQARVDILRKSGSIIDLIEVKAKSIDGTKHLESLEAGGKGLLRDKRKPHGILSAWREKLEDVTYQVLMLEDLLLGVTIRPYLMLVDKSKRSRVNNVPGYFELLWDDRRDGDRRLRSATYIGSASDLESLDLLLQVDVSEEVDIMREEVRAAVAEFEARLDAPLSEHVAARGHRLRAHAVRRGPSGSGREGALPAAPTEVLRAGCPQHGADLQPLLQSRWRRALTPAGSAAHHQVGASRVRTWFLPWQSHRRQPDCGWAKAAIPPCLTPRPAHRVPPPILTVTHRAIAWRPHRSS
jgi:hypothetical protein